MEGMDFSTLLDMFLHLEKHLAVLVRDYGTSVYAILFLIIFVETSISRNAVPAGRFPALCVRCAGWLRRHEPAACHGSADCCRDSCLWFAPLPPLWVVLRQTLFKKKVV